MQLEIWWLKGTIRGVSMCFLLVSIPVNTYDSWTYAYRPYFLLSDSALEEFSDLDTVNEAYDPNKEYDSVILGLAPDRMTYANLNNAFQILNKHKDGSRRPAFITAHKSAYLRTSTGDLSLGPGAFVEALEYSLRPVGVTAEVVGKPQRAFYERVARSLDEGSGQSTTSAIRYADIAVIGDDISADLSEGAVELGFWRVLGEHGLTCLVSLS